MTIKDELTKYLARGILSLPESFLKFLAGKPIVIDGNTLDPVLQVVTKYFGNTPGHVPEIEELRAEIDTRGCWLAHSPHPDVQVTTIDIQGRHGLIPCELHEPVNAPSAKAPLLIYFHGGGHVVGSLKSHHNVCRQLAFEVNCKVIAVDYRLAPEYKFPVGIEDCLDVFDYVVSNADVLGVDPRRVSVGGDSAGGNCAAVVAQQRKSVEYPPRFQLLWVPWLDMSRERPSYYSYGEGFFLDRQEIERLTQLYLSDEGDRFNPLASPLLGEVEGVCPAAIFIAGFDPLRDEGNDYVEKLNVVGVKTYHQIYSGAIHPFINLAGKVPLARTAFDDAVQILRENM